MIEDGLIDFIQRVGFPIVAFLLMWYQANTTIKKNTDALTGLQKSLDNRRIE
jgi:hypothetical protein